MTSIRESTASTPAPAPRAAAPRADRQGAPPAALAALHAIPPPAALHALPSLVGNRAMQNVVARAQVERRPPSAAVGGGRAAVNRPAESPGGRGRPPLHSTEKPLDADLRRRAEGFYGQPLGDVRVHSGEAVDRSASSLGARAFTSGSDVAVRSDSGGERVMAHELAHVVQQRGTRRTMFWRDGPRDEELERRADVAADAFLAGAPRAPDVSSAEGPGAQFDGEGQQDPQAAARRLTYGVTVLSHTRPLTADENALLDRLSAGAPIRDKIRERDQMLAMIPSLQELQARGEAAAVSGPPEHGVAPDAAEMAAIPGRIAEAERSIERLNGEIQADLGAAGFASEAQFLSELRDFPLRWERRAREIAYAMLEENAAIVRHEAGRYRADICSMDPEEVRAADRQLQGIATEISTATTAAADSERQIGEIDTQIEGSEHLAEQIRLYGPAPGGVPLTSEDIAHLNTQREELVRQRDAQRRTIEEKNAELRDTRSRLGLRFPVLFAEQYTPGAFAGASAEALQEMSGSWLDSVLEKIATTRSNIERDRLHVWDLRDVPELAFLSLAVDPNSYLGQAVRDYVAGRVSDEKAVQDAISALILAAAIVATVATLGGAAVVAAAAVGVSAGITLGQLVEHADQYLAESAAEHTALDPALADLSLNEPQLAPMIMDLVALGLDALAITSILRGPARLAIATGDADQFTAAAMRNLPRQHADGFIVRFLRRIGLMRPRSMQAGPYTLLLSDAEGGVFSEGEMVMNLFDSHPHIDAFRASLQRVNATLVPNAALGAEADVQFVRVVGPNGESFTRALVRYNPNTATYAHMQHELNHLQDFIAGRVPAPDVLEVADAAAFAEMRTSGVDALIRAARTAAPAAARPPVQAAEALARKYIAEINNAVRDLETFPARGTTGTSDQLRALEVFQDQTYRNTQQLYINPLRRLLRDGVLAGGRTLQPAELQIFRETVERFVAENFPELAEDFARVYGGNFWQMVR